MRVEDEYIDVLQNIEYAIVDTYRKHHDLSGYDIVRALEVLTDTYSGEKIGRSPRSFKLSDRERDLVDEIRSMCEWRLGRAEPPVDIPLGPDQPEPEPVTIDEILICLKRIDKSVSFWSKMGGMHGYLHFITQHIG